jgi:hypothetical protein
MPAETEPKYPLHAMTTYELRDRRRELERALQDGVIGQAPVAAQLRAQLDAVVAEQAERARIAQSR